MKNNGFMAKFYQMLARRQNDNFNETHYERLMNLIGATANFGLYKLTLHKDNVSNKEIEQMREDGFTIDSYHDAWTIEWNEIDE